MAAAGISDSILVVLPPREGFSAQHFGAIALCVQDFITHSRYRAQSTVIGGIDGDSFPEIPYHALAQKHWWQTRSYAYARACLAQIKIQNPALVEVHNRPNLAHYLAKRWRGKIALHLHNDPQEMKLAKTSAQRQWLLNHCAAIYCVSDYIRQRFVEGLSGDIHKAHVVYNGLALPDPGSFPSKQKKIIFVGRLKPEKGALEFAQAMAKILPAYPEWKCEFIGATRHQPDAKTSPYENTIRSTLDPLGTQLEMLGFCNYAETLRATAEATIAVIPSTWNEAFGRTALEAMSHGCITISSTRGGLREVIGDAALPLYKVNATTIAEAVENVITHPEKWEFWQKHALTQAKHFSIEAVTETLDDIRASLL
jgi:glycosyltransferase involved in cell wall biosynthesis